jgi:hypothetical protein
MTELLEALRQGDSPYQLGGEHSFFRDLYWRSFTTGHLPARGRLDRHQAQMQMRSTAVMASGGGVIAPTYMAEAFAPYSHGGRPAADACRVIPIVNANPLVVPVANEGATVDVQAVEGEGVPAGDFAVLSQLASPVTLSGKVDVSRQLVEGSAPSVDGLFYSDGLSALNARIEALLLGALENLPALPAAGGITELPAPAAGTTVIDSFIEASRLIRNDRKEAATAVFLSADDWAALVSLRDDNGAYLIPPGVHRAAPGLVDLGGVAAEVANLSIIPTHAATAGTAYVVRSLDICLFESSTREFRFEDRPAGPETVTLAVWGYAAPVVNRYLSGIVRVLTQ